MEFPLPPWSIDAFVRLGLARAFWFIPGTPEEPFRDASVLGVPSLLFLLPGPLPLQRRFKKRDSTQGETQSWMVFKFFARAALCFLLQPGQRHCG